MQVQMCSTADKDNILILFWYFSLLASIFTNVVDVTLLHFIACSTFILKHFKIKIVDLQEAFINYLRPGG